MRPPKKPTLRPFDLSALALAHEYFARYGGAARSPDVARQCVSDVWDSRFTEEEIKPLVRKRIVREVTLGRDDWNTVSRVTWDLTDYGLRLFAWWDRPPHIEQMRAATPEAFICAECGSATEMREE